MEFSALTDELLAAYYRLDPVHATDLGFHDYDGQWPDLTDAGRAARLAYARDALARLGAVDVATLTRDEAIDHRILVGAAESMAFSEETLQEERWNPLAFVYLFGNGLFGLLARDFAPLPDRLRSATARLQAMPALVDAAKEQLAHPGERPVAQFHTEKAIERLPGIASAGRRARGRAGQGRGRGDPGRAAPRPGTGGGRRQDCPRRVRDVDRGHAPAHRHRRLPPGPGPVSRQVPPRPAGRDGPRRAAGAGERRVRGRALRDPAPGRRAVARLEGRRAHARQPRRRGPRRPRRHRDRPPQGGRAAGLLPRRERADRDVLHRHRSHRSGRRAHGDRVDPAVPALLRWSHADPTRPARPRAVQLLRHHPHARRLDRRAA